MSGQVENLVKMANNIEAFFRADPDPEAAVAGIENHLRRFWEPRMRRAIVAYVDAGGLGLGELVVRAIRRIGSTDTASC
jgi:formate dehydrogenase subunit delta